MKYRGVITGDIIQSTEISIEGKAYLPETLVSTFMDIQKHIDADLQYEIYRGDSFQLLTGKPEEALRIATLIRTGLKSKTPQDEKRCWDCRIAIGIGEVNLELKQLAVSDGEAFRLSGRGLDSMDSKQSLVINTPWKENNEEFILLSAFTGDLISNWTRAQSEAIYPMLLNRFNQKELAAYLNVSTQVVNKRFSSAKTALIELSLNRYSKIIEKHTTNDNQ